MQISIYLTHINLNLVVWKCENTQISLYLTQIYLNLLVWKFGSVEIWKYATRLIFTSLTFVYLVQCGSMGVQKSGNMQINSFAPGKPKLVVPCLPFKIMHPALLLKGSSLRSNKFLHFISFFPHQRKEIYKLHFSTFMLNYILFCYFPLQLNPGEKWLMLI